MQPLQQLKADLQNFVNPEKARNLARFFKTGKGQYGEGDMFLGIMVPVQRRVAKSYASLSLKDIKILLASRIHEHRFIALLILVDQYQKADEQTKQKIANFYHDHTACINNWDLVDLSAPHILGAHCYENDTTMLYRLAESENLWKRRIAIMATFAFIRKGRFKETLEISRILMHDRHDLIHKAVGWMLREIGKRDVKREEEFLKRHADAMPRVMLRYAIERFDNKKRNYWMSRKENLVPVSSEAEQTGQAEEDSSACR
ncbi:MAG: DNA alkylation repair protein [Nitrospirae bacterium]|nr:DNA alkylation repair protein [Nitrospirota bacterium]